MDGFFEVSTDVIYRGWMDGWIDRLTRLSETGNSIREKNVARDFIKPSKIDRIIKSIRKFVEITDLRQVWLLVSVGLGIVSCQGSLSFSLTIKRTK